MTTVVRPWFGRAQPPTSHVRAIRRRIGLTPEVGGRSSRPNHALTCVVTVGALVRSGGVRRVVSYLIVGGRYADAEPVLREGLAILQTVRSGDWETSHARTLLGHALLGQETYAEAEPFLIQGYEGLKAHEALIAELLAEHLIAGAGEAVGELDEAWGRPEKATAWRSKLTSTGRAHEHASHATPKDRAHSASKPRSPR